MSKINTRAKIRLEGEIRGLSLAAQYMVVQTGMPMRHYRHIVAMMKDRETMLNLIIDLENEHNEEV